MTRLVFIFFYIATFFCFAQQPEWFALSDFGGMVNVEVADTDHNGNVFVAGRFHGEAEFASASKTDSIFKDYVSESFPKTFLVRYTPEGKCIFLVTMKTQGSNSDLPYAYGIKALSNGDVLLALHCGYDYKLTDATGKKHERLHEGLLRISGTGELLWSQRFRIGSYCKIAEDPLGNIFISQYNGYKNQLVMLSDKGIVKKQTDLGSCTVSDMKYLHDQLWIVAYNANSIRNDKLPFLGSREIGLFSVSNNDTLRCVQHFSLPLNYQYSNYSFIVSTWKGKPSLELFVQLEAPVTLAGKSFNKNSGPSLLAKFDSFGNIVQHRQFNASAYYNYGISSDLEGSTYLWMPVHKSIYLPETDTLRVANIREHRDELFYFKFNQHYKVDWNLKGGGTASNYHYSIVSANRKNVYTTSDLVDYISLSGKQRAIKWKMGLYVMKLTR